MLLRASLFAAVLHKTILEHLINEFNMICKDRPVGFGVFCFIFGSGSISSDGTLGIFAALAQTTSWRSATAAANSI
jgi:hypothetical protein